MEDYPLDTIPQGAVEYVFTTHVTHQEQFFVHVESRSKILDDIMENLAARYMDLGPGDKVLNNKKLGSLCAAKFTDDNNWYRAKITGMMKNGLIEVQFVDYGNTDYVSEDRVRALDPDLVQYPVQSYRCALAGVSCAQGYWSPEQMVQFEDRVVDRKCQAVFMGKRENDEVYLLEMYDEEGTNLNQMFGAGDIGNSAKGSQVVQNGSDGGFKEKVLSAGMKFQATVVYVKNPGLFWCQDTAYANEILILSEELSRLHMTQSIKPLRNVAPGAVCAAKFSEDEAWYRGIVQSVSRNSAKVYFVDYGNTESVSLDVICNLKPEMRKLPTLAIKCSLASVQKKGSSWSPEAVEKFEELVVDKEFEVNVINREGDSYIVSLLDIVENKDVGSQVQIVVDNSKAETPPKGTSSMQQPSGAIPGIGPSLSVGSKAMVYLSWIDSPGDFWIQSSESENLLTQLSEQLQEVYSQPQPAAHPAPGAFVVARFSEDRLWYRGLVLKDFDDGHVRVLFIDYGNSDTLPSSELKQVTPAFGQIIPLAYRCALAGVKPLRKGDKSWTGDAKDFLEKLTADGCLCEVLDETDSHRLVKLSVGDKDVARELVGLRVVAGGGAADSKPHIPSFAQSVRVRKGDRDTVTVTHTDSPQSFWCQLSKNTDALDELMAKLEQHYCEDGGTPVREPALGQACIAQYSVDNAWYRATITNASQSGYDVHFVDYGNCESVLASAACEPEPRFLDLPVQAIHCSLPVSGDMNYLSATFSDAVLEKELQMEVLDITNEMAIVELIDGKMQISEYLKGISFTSPPSKIAATTLLPAKTIPNGQSVKVFTSVVISPSKFFLQMAGIDEELGALMDRIALKYVSDTPPSLITAPKVGQPCVALYSEDNHWYRGKIVSVQGNQCSVLFVDYGNEETIGLENIHVLTADIANVPVMAYQCSLRGAEQSSWSASAKDFFESLVMDQELECTFVTPNTVKLICNGEDAMSQLANAGHIKDIRAMLSPKQTPATSGWDDNEAESGFGASPRKGHEESGGFGGGRRGDSGAFGGGRRDKDNLDRSFGDRQGKSSGFGGKRGDGDGGGFGGRRNERDSGFGGGRGDRESGFGGGNRGGRDRESGFGGGGRGGGDRDSGFGGGRRERKTSSDSAASSSGEFTYADPPCEPESAILVHMDEDGTFYLQLPSMERDILFLSKRLAGSYKGGGGPRLKETAAKGTVCCAKFPEDGNMYRSLVEEVNGNNVILRYIDYGNTAECSLYDLKFLFPDLLQYPAQAFPCKLRGLDWSLDLVEKFAKATLDKDLTVTFTSPTRPFEVDIKTPEGDLLGILTGKVVPPAAKLSPKPSGFGIGKTSPKFQQGSGFGTSTPKKDGRRALNFGPSSPASSPPSTPPIPKQEFLMQTAPEGESAAFISHIGGNGYFYLQLEKDTAVLENISGTLLRLSKDVKHPSVTAGAACAAIFSEDSAWYRALINSAKGDTLEVTFVDYGNGDSVSISSIKPLSSELLALAPLAYQSQFPDIGPLSPEAQTKLAEYLLEHQVIVSFSGSKPPFDVSIITSDGQDLQEIICPSNQYRSQPVPREVIPAGVSHIVDDGRFFLQLYENYRVIAEMQEKLSTAYEAESAERLESPEIGIPCCVKSDDESWHRGKIVEIKDNTAQVFCVDTGKTTTSEVDDIFSLSAEYLKKPPFALECRLKGVESWTDDLRAKFTEMTEGKILNATFYTATPPFRVSLARSIELDLLGLAAPTLDSPTRSPERKPVSSSEAVSKESEPAGDGVVPAYISQVEPDGTFYIQIVAKEDALNDLADNLETALATSECLNSAAVGDIVCAKFTEDDAWYRARVESCDAEGQYQVRFLDYGNTDVVGADRLASLPENLDFPVIPAFASKCCFTDFSADLSSEQIDALRDLVTEKVVNISFKSEKGDIHEVEAELDGKSLTQMLGLDVKDLPSEQNEDPAYISQVEPDGTFFVQLVSREDALNDLADSLESFLESAAEVDDVSVNATVCAKFTEDDSWYRAKVESCDADGQFHVRFLDYGNTDVVGKDRLAPLLESMNLATIPPFATKCRLAGVAARITSEQADQLKEIVTEKVVGVKFKPEKDGLQEVEVSLDGVPLTQMLGIATQNNTEELNKTGESTDKDEFADAVEDLEVGTAQKSAAVTETDSKQDTEEESEEFVETSEANPEEARGAEAAVLKDEPQVESLESVPKGVSQPSLEMAAGQRLAVTVSSVDSPDAFYIQLDKNKASLDELMDAMFEYFSSLPEGDGTVQTLNIGDVCAALFEDESWYRVRVEGITDDGTYTVFYMDHGNTEAADNSALRQLPERFQSQSPWAVQAKLGGVRPAEGDQWSDEAVEEFKNIVEEKSLLADIVETAEDGSCVVRLLELGIPVHEELIKKGYARAGEEITVSKTVQHVFSDNESSVAHKSEDLSTCLDSTQSESHDEMAKKQVISSTAHAEQRLGCVSSNLEELKEVSVYVSHSVSPSLFWCQLSSSTDTLAEINDSLITAYSLPDEGDKITGSLNAGDLVVAVFTEDEQLYRSRVLSLSEAREGDDESELMVAVRFVDYGNESETPRTQVYKIRDSLCRVPAQAICCCLDKVQPLEDSWLPEACAKFSEIVSDQELSLKLVGREQDGTILVDLVLTETGQSVLSLLVEAGLAKLVDSEPCIKSSTTKNLDATKPGDVTEMDSLEITQPIMESTAMVGDNTQHDVQTYSFEDADESHFRTLRLSLHTEYDVTVTNHELPNCFHVQLQELRNQFTSLMAEIAEHVVSDSCADSTDFSPKLGDVCLVQHCGVWYRGEVVAHEGDSWNVRSVDCGWEAGVSQSEIKPLPSRFTDLPAQAVPCYLAGIVSVEAEWCTDAITFFIDCVKDAKLCMYVLENANDGKYGVYLSDLDNTGSQSVNRAMVDVGYAEVVPGSNIEVDIEMEKTLDTDMLNDLEESFNEVSHMKCNDDDNTRNEAPFKSTADSENPLGDTYEESEVCKDAKKGMNTKVYHLVQLSGSVLASDESGKYQADSEGVSTPKSDTGLVSGAKNSSFNLASAVERIDKHGCVDHYPEESLTTVEEEIEEGGSGFGTIAPSSQKLASLTDGGDTGSQKGQGDIAETMKTGKEEGENLHWDESKVVQTVPHTETKTKALYTWKAESLMDPRLGTHTADASKTESVKETDPEQKARQEKRKGEIEGGQRVEPPADRVVHNPGNITDKVLKDSGENSDDANKIGDSNLEKHTSPTTYPVDETEAVNVAKRETETLSDNSDRRISPPENFEKQEVERNQDKEGIKGVLTSDVEPAEGKQDSDLVESQKGMIEVKIQEDGISEIKVTSEKADLIVEVEDDVDILAAGEEVKDIIGEGDPCAAKVEAVKEAVENTAYEGGLHAAIEGGVDMQAVGEEVQDIACDNMDTKVVEIEVGVEGGLLAAAAEDDVDSKAAREEAAVTDEPLPYEYYYEDEHEIASSSLAHMPDRSSDADSTSAEEKYHDSLHEHECELLDFKESRDEFISVTKDVQEIHSNIGEDGNETTSHSEKVTGQSASGDLSDVMREKCYLRQTELEVQEGLHEAQSAFFEARDATDDCRPGLLGGDRVSGEKDKDEGDKNDGDDDDDDDDYGTVPSSVSLITPVRTGEVEEYQGQLHLEPEVGSHAAEGSDSGHNSSAAEMVSSTLCLATSDERGKMDDYGFNDTEGMPAEHDSQTTTQTFNDERSDLFSCEISLPTEERDNKDADRQLGVEPGICASSDEQRVLEEQIDRNLKYLREKSGEECSEQKSESVQSSPLDEYVPFAFEGSSASTSETSSERDAQLEKAITETREFEVAEVCTASNEQRAIEEQTDQNLKYFREKSEESSEQKSESSHNSSVDEHVHFALESSSASSCETSSGKDTSLEKAAAETREFEATEVHTLNEQWATGEKTDQNLKKLEEESEELFKQSSEVGHRNSPDEYVRFELANSNASTSEMSSEKEVEKTESDNRESNTELDMGALTKEQRALEVDQNSKNISEKSEEFPEQSSEVTHRNSPDEYVRFALESSSSTSASETSSGKDTSMEKTAFVSCLDIDVRDLDSSGESAGGTMEKKEPQEVLHEVSSYGTVEKEESEEAVYEESSHGVSTSDIISGHVSAEGDASVEVPGQTEADDKAVSVSSSSSVAGTVSLDTTIDEYESCSELVNEEEWPPFGDESSIFSADSSVGPLRRNDDVNESSYDTSSLVFSDSCIDSSVDTSTLYTSYGTETSTVETESEVSSHAGTLNTTSDTQSGSTTSSSVFNSTCQSASTETTSLGSSSGNERASGQLGGIANGINDSSLTDESISDLDPFDLSGVTLPGVILPAPGNQNGIIGVEGVASASEEQQGGGGNHEQESEGSDLSEGEDFFPASDAGMGSEETSPKLVHSDSERAQSLEEYGSSATEAAAAQDNVTKQLEEIEEEIGCPASVLPTEDPTLQDLPASDKTEEAVTEQAEEREEEIGCPVSVLSADPKSQGILSFDKSEDDIAEQLKEEKDRETICPVLVLSTEDPEQHGTLPSDPVKEDKVVEDDTHADTYLQTEDMGLEDGGSEVQISQEMPKEGTSSTGHTEQEEGASFRQDMRQEKAIDSACTFADESEPKQNTAAKNDHPLGDADEKPVSCTGEDDRDLCLNEDLREEFGVKAVETVGDTAVKIDSLESDVGGSPEATTMESIEVKCKELKSIKSHCPIDCSGDARENVDLPLEGLTELIAIPQCEETGEQVCGASSELGESETARPVLVSAGKLESQYDVDTDDSGPPSYHEDIVNPSQDPTLEESAAKEDQSVNAAGDASFDSKEDVDFDDDKENREDKTGEVASLGTSDPEDASEA